MTTHVIYGAGTWGTFANAFFTLSGIFGDLLIIRFCLCCAYLFLLISASLGFPAPPYWGFTGVVAIGAIAWSAVNLFLQVWAFVVLCWDERPVTFKSDDEEQLWRFMLRRAGMHRVDFLQVLRRGSFKRVQAGDAIMDLERDEEVSLFLMIEGVATWTREDCKPELNLTFCSGELFDLTLFNLFGVHVGFSGPVLQKVMAQTDCLVFCWPIKSVLEMANGQASFAVAGYMRNLALYSIAAEFNRRVVLERQIDLDYPMYMSTGDPEPAGWAQGERSLDFTAALRPDERKPTPLKRFAALLSRSFGLRPPPGIRHDNMPATGALARNRTIVLAKITEAPRMRKRDYVAASFASMRGKDRSSSGRKRPESNSSQCTLETVQDSNLESVRSV